VVSQVVFASVGGPVVSGHTGKAVALDCQVVFVHFDAEEAVFTPVGAPGVATDPVLGVRLLIIAVANDRDLMVNQGKTLALTVDAAGVSIEVGSRVNATADRAVSVELSLHLLGSHDCVILVNVILFRGSHGTAAIEAILTLWWWGP